MTGLRLKVTGRTFGALKEHFSEADEHMAILFGQRHGDTVLVADRDVQIIQDSAYVHRSAGRVELDKTVNNLIHHRFAVSGCNTYIHLHDHPHADLLVDFSPVDDAADLDLRGFLDTGGLENVRKFGGSGIERIELVTGVFGSECVKLRSVSSDGSFTPVDSLFVVDEVLDQIRPDGRARQPTKPADEALERQVAFVGTAGQARLSQITVMIAGVGGVGSVIAEAMARMGVGRLLLVDHDLVEVTNLNRLVGAGPTDVGTPKVDVLKRHLTSITPACTVEAIGTNLFDVDPASFAAADLIMSATDDSVTRSYLNRAAVQYLLPLIDHGTIIDPSPLDFRQRLSVVVPGTTACLECSAISVLDGQEIADAYATGDERRLFRAKGYVQDHPEIISPSVMALNLQIAGLGVQEMMNLLFGWRPLTTNAYSAWREGANKRIDRSVFADLPDAACPCCSNYLGSADLATLPTPTDEWRDD
ncbi:MAG: ThiF family adenylyltransferase [Erythrobacter sp.]|nr:ThiF family adenylyltransferase [Erythrobacter sp.]